MSMDYASFVEARCRLSPCLQTLHTFLTTSVTCANTERIVALDFFPGGVDLEQRQISPSHLAEELRQPAPEDKTSDRRMLGKILLIENISRDIMLQLGSRLSIDPLFFAGHVHSAWRDVGSQPPKFCELPSRVTQQTFSTFTYHRSLLFPRIDDADFRLLRQSNIDRKVVVFPGERGRRIGLAQHCCSVLMVPGQSERWIALVLIDPPIRDTYVSLRRKQEAVVIHAPSTPLFGGTESSFPAQGSYADERSESCPSMLDQLLLCWQSGRPDGFKPAEMTLGALAYFPLRTIASEWVNYMAFMSLSLRQYETVPSARGISAEDLKRINAALVAISSWPRRVSSSATSLDKCSTFIQQHACASSVSEGWQSLQKDYEHLSRTLAQNGKHLEAAGPLVAMYLQLTESRRAHLETENVSRLTILALFFVPLTFVSGLFSMNPDFGPGGPRFWLYFVVATPVLIAVLLVARPSVRCFMFGCVGWRW